MKEEEEDEEEEEEEKGRRTGRGRCLLSQRAVPKRKRLLSHSTALAME